MLTPSELRDFPWRCLSWLIVNQGELLDLLSALGIASDNSDSAGNVEEQAQKELLQLRGAEGFGEMGLVCTLGAQGILYLSKEMSVAVYMPAAKVLYGVVDTTGAGDCFAGYFAAGLMRSGELEETLRTCLTVSV